MNKEYNKAQSTVEFTFAMVAVMFLIYGMVMMFRWAGMDLANRRVSQDLSLTNQSGPFAQLNAVGDVVLPMDAVYHGGITNEDGS